MQSGEVYKLRALTITKLLVGIRCFHGCSRDSEFSFSGTGGSRTVRLALWQNPASAPCQGVSNSGNGRLKSGRSGVAEERISALYAREEATVLEVADAVTPGKWAEADPTAPAELAHII